MCSLCGQLPCNPKCPNAPYVNPLYWCSRCGNGIYSGEYFFDGYGGKVCEDCLDEMTAHEIIKMCGDELKLAEGTV